MSEEQLINTPCLFGENQNFMLERELGRGGMGGVYMGRDKMLDRPVAVKVMLKEYGSDPDFVEKFKKEAQAAAKLIHPNIAQIYSYGISEGMPYIAMELVAGGSLDKLMEHSGAKIDVPRVMKICEQVAQALRCAADQGLVHGDVKPENILLDANGNAKLVDFGLAAMQKDTNEIWGTPYYIAPEKVKKEPVDYRADMYSLGGTIYHALTGVAPFEGEDATDVVRKRFFETPKKPSEVRPGLSPQIDFLVMKMLSMNPEDRYPSFEALLEDYKKVLTKGPPPPQTLTPAEAAAAGAAVGGTGRIATSAGGKKLMIKPRRKLTVNRAQADEAVEEGDVPEMATGVAARHRLDYDEEEEQGGVGGKVAMVIGGVIAGIVIILGLVWFAWSSNIAKNQEKERIALEAGFKQARDGLVGVKEKLPDFEKKVDGLYKKIEADCTDLQKVMVKEFGDMCPADLVPTIRPGKTKALLDAERALTGQAAAQGGAAPAKPAAAPAKPTEAQRAAANKAAVEKGLKFRDPVGDEADPNSPYGEKYQEEKAKWLAEQAKKAAESAPRAEAAPEAAATAGAPQGDVFPAVLEGIRKMGELWTKTYDAQAGALKLKAMIAELDADIDGALAPRAFTGAEQKALADLTNKLIARYNELLQCAEFTELQKMEMMLDKGGASALKRVRIKIRDERRRREQVEDEARKKREAEEAAKKAADRRAQLIEEGLENIHTKFQAICQNGNLRQLDWKGAKRQLVALKDSLVDDDGKIIAELELEADKEIRKVDMMASVQMILQRNLKGYVFQRFTKGKHLKGMEVLSVDDRQFIVRKVGSAVGQKTIPWQSFYRDYHVNLGELCEKYIRKGRDNGEPRLNLREQADAMFGVALTMQLVFADEPSAASYGESMAKAAVKMFPNYLDYAKEVFPDLDFSDVEKEAAESAL